MSNIQTLVYEYKEDRQYIYKSNIEGRSRNQYFRGKAISVLYSNFMSVTLVMQHAKCTHRIKLSSVTCLSGWLAQINISALSYKRHDVIKILPTGAQLFHADGQKDGWADRQDEANSCFSQYCEHA
jgi:hypothetical protein